MHQGKQSLVRHMLSIDWKYWKLYLRPSSARSITIRMVERLAGNSLLLLRIVPFAPFHIETALWI